MSRGLGVTPGGAEFRAALAALTPQLRGFARFLARDAARADDLVQDALLRALEHAASWQEGTELRAWIFRILRNAFLDEERRRGTERRGLAAMPAPEAPAPAQTAAADLGDLARGLSDLPAPQREALLLVAALGFEVAEAAAITGVPAGTVKARLSRARASLARRFGPRA
nr:RNA polymerase sigma factor [Neoroseomonas oryzicola]